MDSKQFQHVKEIFLLVCQRPEDEQTAAIAELCGDDEELKAEVESLLEAHHRAEATSKDSLGISTQVDAVGPLSSGDARSTIKSRFAPGTVLDERYRIVSLLGIGGMGEVYRADDLTLEQVVALKFLPKAYSADPDWLERFHNEVRMSRQVTHPNVCRIFDLGTVDGEQFITMEFVDGEDLSSLLRRIGRLPGDKALQIARQLCAGLAAAHDRGVLHRDLKPANVMIDGRGQVRITDFGISAPMSGPGSTASAAGTPAYMAPEQFTNGQATLRSDVYSLGLVLYELFTGRQAFSADSVLVYARLHKQTSPTHPSTFIPDMDPLVERVIMRCLEKDPMRRPPGALAVAAALPGGDPLAAALAAGETPTPEMVAAAGGDSVLTSARGAILLLLTLAGLVVATLLAGNANLLPRMAAGKAPAVLADKSREVLAAVGCGQPLIGRAQGYGLNVQLISWLQKHDSTRGLWDRLSAPRAGAAIFWYRQSPQPMVSRDDIGVVTLDEPARSVPGMRTVELDVLGRLRRLEILPDLAEPGADGDSEESSPDFGTLFALAGLNFGDFSPTAPAWMPPMYADSRYAWTGHYPENPDQVVNVEAAVLHGRCVFFNVFEPWQDEAEHVGLPPPVGARGGNVVFQVGILLVTLVGVVLAWHHLRTRRGDSSGAHKLSAAFLLLGILIWLLSSSHVPQLSLEISMFYRVLGFILVPAGIVWLFYLAMEPYVRRIWPETVISWNRLLGSRINDPLVASHVLIGLAVAGAATLLTEMGNLIPMWMGHAPVVPNLAIPIRFLARDDALAISIWSLLISLYTGLLYLLLLVLLQLVLRRRWAASVMYVILVGSLWIQWDDIVAVQIVISILVAGLTLLLLVRYGLVAAVASLWAIHLLRDIPLTSDFNVWYADQTRFVVGLLIVVAVAAATVATRGWRGLGGHNAPLPV
ncbi:MAG: serine/threonine-protein kinase [Tepidisphaeraceae bacterium]|jgi:serine/threonine-protein kinase